MYNRLESVKAPQLGKGWSIPQSRGTIYTQMLAKASSNALFLLNSMLHPAALLALSVRILIVSSSSAYPCMSGPPLRGTGCGAMPIGRGCPPAIVGAYCPASTLMPPWELWLNKYTIELIRSEGVR